MVDQITAMYEISIHALRKESDSPDLTVQSAVDISIHALRKESDVPTIGISHRYRNFNPRSP